MDLAERWKLYTEHIPDSQRSIVALVLERFSHHLSESQAESKEEQSLFLLLVFLLPKIPSWKTGASFQSRWQEIPVAWFQPNSKAYSGLDAEMDGLDRIRQQVLDYLAQHYESPIEFGPRLARLEKREDAYVLFLDIINSPK